MSAHGIQIEGRGEKFEGEIKVFFCLVMSRLVDCKLLFDFGLCTVLYNYLSTMEPM